MNSDDRADALVGLTGFRVLDVVVGAELEVTLETTAHRVGCPDCGVLAALHDRREHVVRDLPAGDRPVVIVWRKRVWRCREPLCARQTWSERSAEIAPKATLTERARRDICRRVALGTPVAKAAFEFGVAWETAMRAVRDYGTPLVDDPQRTDGVVALGVDEHSFLLANGQRHTQFCTGFVDLERGRLLDVVRGRSGDDVAYWLAQAPPAWLEEIREAALDPHRGYANGLLRYLEHAIFVLDHFHAIKLANVMVDDVRRRVQNETLGHRGRKHDPLFRIRRLLLRASETLTDRQWQRLHAGIDAGDNTHCEITSAWFAKEALRAVYDTTDRAEAERRLNAFYAETDQWRVPEARRLARTIRAWQDELLAWHATTGTSNGTTEAINLLIEKTRRLGHGFRNFDNYRLRLLLTCGGINWQTHPVARLRAHTPRLVA